MATFGTSNKYINYSVNSQELSYDINSNTSVVRVWIDVWRTNTGYVTKGSGTVYAGINGGQYSAPISADDTITSTARRLGTWDVTIPHNEDGSKQIWISGWINHSQFSASEQGYMHTLTTIPRVSGVRCSGGTFGSALTIYFDRKSNNFTHHLYYSLNGGPETGIGADYSASATWTPPLSLLNSVTGTDSATIMFRAYTFNGGTNIGNSTCTCTVKVPTNIVPTFTSVTATVVNPFGTLYLQGKSNIKLTVNGASGVYGSTIKTYSISGGDYSYSGTTNTYTTGVVDKSGDITFTATITDSRGRTASKTVKVTVTAYMLPTLTFETYRCSSSGAKDVTKGTYIYVKPIFTFANITGNAIKTKSIKINGTSKSTTFNSGQGYVFGTYPLRSTHEVEVSITDNVGNTVSLTHDIGIGKVIFNAPPHKNGVGWGRYCDKEGEFQVGYDLNVFGELLLNGMNLIDFIYPIGTQIYNSSKSFNPNTLYKGTTWKRIKGYVLAGINEEDKEPTVYLNFNKEPGTTIGASYQDLRAWIGAYDSDIGALGYYPQDKVPGQYFTYGFRHSGERDIGYNRIAHTTMVSNTSGQQKISVMQPTMFTYIWERTA